ncbi:MAG TPA: hypothetical protein VFU00_11935 [Gemmatimonadales bacterium]|nr:hypothetical protein [Gemmatimonadales bacterium]
MSSRHRFLAPIILAAASASLADAQAPAASRVPFGTISPSLALAGELARSSSLDPWEPAPGFQLLVRAPFYAGAVELGVQQLSHDSRRAGIPGFRARYVFVGWALDATPLPRLTLAPGLRFGIYDMQFDDESLPDYAESENEMAAALTAEAAYLIGGKWSGVAGLDARLVFTEPRMRQLGFTAGLRYTLASPEWLRDFLD